MMSEIITRKCRHCGGQVILERDNIHGATYYKGGYFHSDCFQEYAQEKLAAAKRSPSIWATILSDISPYETEAVKMTNMHFKKNDFTSYLLQNYNITAVPESFWRTIGLLAKGEYKKKQCLPVDMITLFEAWQWWQRNLNRIAVNNKKNNKKQFNNGEDRLKYDLAIIIRKIPNYLSYKAKQEAQIAEMEMQKAQPKINYNNIPQKQEKTENKFDDISDLLDDIF